MSKTKDETTASSSASSCPYAVNVNVNHTNTSAPSSSPGDDPAASGSKNSNLSAMKALQLAKESCPAFKSACPFRNVQDAESMKIALQSLPKSHLDSARSSFTISSTTGTTNGNAPVSAEDSGGSSIHSNDENDIRGDRSSRRLSDSEIGESLRVAITHVHNISQSLDAGVGTGTVAIPHGVISTFPNGGGHVSADSSIKSATDGNYGFAMPGIASAMEEFSLFAQIGKIIERNSSTSPSSSHEDPAKSSGGGMKRVKSATSLSHALKHGTQESHNAAESVHFVKEFINGNIDRTLYSILILNLLHLYENLEQLLDQHAPHHFPSLHFSKELSRREALEDDVDFFLGVNGRATKEASAATRDYIARIRYIAEKEPLLLLSHGYTRYMGDLSGGKVLARVAKRALNLKGGDDDDGLAFYSFENIPSAKLFKDEYRKALDDLILDDEQIERLVAEANVAFILNMRIFEELDVLNGIEGAVVRDFEAATVYFDDCLRKQKERALSGNVSFEFVHDAEEEEEDAGDDAAKCPFAMLGGPNPHKTTQKNSSVPNPISTGNAINSVEMEKKYADAIMSRSLQGLQSIDAVKATTTSTSHGSKERCPWPFVFFHDPKTGMQDYQTWIVIGLLLCYFWSLIQKHVM